MRRWWRRYSLYQRREGGFPLFSVTSMFPFGRKESSRDRGQHVSSRSGSHLDQGGEYSTHWTLFFGQKRGRPPLSLWVYRRSGGRLQVKQGTGTCPL